MSESKPKTTIVRAAVYQLGTGEQFVIGYRPSPDAEWITTGEEVEFDIEFKSFPVMFRPNELVPVAMLEAELPRGIRTYQAKVVEGGQP